MVLLLHSYFKKIPRFSWGKLWESASFTPMFVGIYLWQYTGSALPSVQSLAISYLPQLSPQFSEHMQYIYTQMIQTRGIYSFFKKDCEYEHNFQRRCIAIPPVSWDPPIISLAYLFWSQMAWSIILLTFRGRVIAKTQSKINTLDKP